ncbi:MAG: hypothetical protein HN703_05770 [Planctomycetaceae bacterium]|nr:hypothetical protein [Planctomycetaceae bacterium]
MSSHVLQSPVGLLQHAGAQIVLIVSGGGTQVIPKLLAEGGASGIMLEALVPYARSAIRELLGGEPGTYCSDRTVRQMAVAGWQRSIKLSNEVTNNVGVAATASLRAGNQKRGQHRIHVATHHIQGTRTATLQLTKNLRSRSEEEHIAALLCLDVLVGTFIEKKECPWRTELKSLLVEGEDIVREQYMPPNSWQRLFSGDELAIPVETNVPTESRRISEKTQDRLIFSGSFAPLHDGHLAMAHLAEEIAERPVEWELSVSNVDKPMLDYIEILRRAEQFKGKRLWLSRAPTFIEKIQAFPQSTFVMGADTYRRLTDLKYYGGSQQQLHSAMQTICRKARGLIVFGRVQNGEFENPADFNVPTLLREVTYFVSEREFRIDISSSHIRANKKWS